jgi:pSer/pThr/pTyr-binding forkhead associated (FHA) protein
MGSPESLTAVNSVEAFATACKFTGPLTLQAVNRVTALTQSFHVNRPFTFLGRVKGIGVQLDDPSVSQCHAYLQVVEGVPHCTDLGSRTGVLWDDGGRGQGPVYPGQTLRLGVFDVQFLGGGEAGSLSDEDNRLTTKLGQPPPPHTILEVNSSNGQNGHLPIDQAITLVGRHPNCNLRFLDPAISYFQCALVSTPDGVWCVDLLSRKGTVVNGRATRLTRLHDSDLLELGPVSLVLRTGAQAGQPLFLSGRGNFPPVNAPTGGPNGSEMVATALAPLREMMEQFQQCFVTMARMFATMQQEHTAMMCEQMRQIQELMRESRGTGERTAGPEPTLPLASNPASAVPPPPPASPKVPTPKMTQQGPEADALADAHTWFLDRMAKFGQGSTQKRTDTGS